MLHLLILIIIFTVIIQPFPKVWLSYSLLVLVFFSHEIILLHSSLLQMVIDWMAGQQMR